MLQRSHFISGLPRPGSTLLRRNPRFRASLGSPAEGMSTEAKIIACDALKQACHGARADRLLPVRYEILASQPPQMMDAVHDFIGEPSIPHDFRHVGHGVADFDRRAGAPGLHAVRGRPKVEPRNTLLSPDLFQRTAGDAFRNDPRRLPAGLRIV